MNKSVFTCLAGLVSITLLVAVGRLWWDARDAFPYGHSNAGVQIRLLDGAATATGRAVYEIAAGEIKGEAVLESASTVAEGLSMVNSSLVGVKSTFKSSRAPYAGHITATIDCGAQKYVKEEAISFAGRTSELILAVASERRVFGVCSVNQVKYVSATWAAYDAARRKVVTVKLFKPVSDPAKLEESQQQVLTVFNKVINYPGGI